MAQGDRARGRGGEQETGGEEVGVGDVADVGEVEDVCVVAELDVGLVVVVGPEEAGEGLDVALAEDASGADGGGQEVGALLTVGLDDELFGSGLEGRQLSVLNGVFQDNKRSYLGLGVVLLLLSASDDGVTLVRVVQVVLIVADDAGRAGIHKGLDARLLTGLNDGAGAADIDLAEEVVGRLAVAAYDGRGRVDDDVGLDPLQDLGQLGGIGDVALVVRGLIVDVAGASQVDGGHGGAGP